MYLRNELKLTYHYILSYIYNTFIVRHNKRIIYFKNIYKTDLCDCLKRNTKGTHLYSRWAYKRGGLISGWAYIRNNIFADKWMGLNPGGGLKTGGALKWDFTVFDPHFYFRMSTSLLLYFYLNVE